MGYDLVDDYFDYIVPSFMDLYNIDLLDKKQDPPYPKFLLLLGGLHDTSLNKIIELRLEDNKDLISKFNINQKREWDRWQNKKYEKDDFEEDKWDEAMYKEAYGFVDKIL